ncbi:SGNH/GDSL hydrolase family protein [Paenibacillus mendelii]|uniref:SGNH/GDSL hydrolase family protein n=1 Tax=Paenibacillus mendelii TaxID=206163 RepID=A0ABV6JIS4_9BACL|nr:SGNH/GDSL hydrolase family protein [Paenibacillus mendelii]MCQ6558740.1 SGNH/GDSL hydrolase family protein [Paenibacillus mendelii]
MDKRIWNPRSSLLKLQAAIERGEVTIGFLGGSITEARPGHNWPEKVMAWLVETYPQVRFYVENAAIGATGSDLAVFRAGRDIVAKSCDVVFVEYAVNDHYAPHERRSRSREGLLRLLLASSEADLVLVYTYLQAMYAEMEAGGVPESIKELEQLGEHYNIGSVWMGLYAFEEVRKGRMAWEEWLPDGLHPTHRGSLSYAQSVITFLEKQLHMERIRQPGVGEVPSLTENRGERVLPEPLNRHHWGNVSFVPFREVQTEGPWAVHRSVNLVWMEQMLTTSAVGAKLRFVFYGRGLTLGFDFGMFSADFLCRIDDGEALEIRMERAEWCPAEGLFHIETVAEDLLPERHEAEIEVIHGNGPRCQGTRFRLAFIGIIG